MVIKVLKRSYSGKKLSSGRKDKRTFKNKSRFNHNYLKREQYVVDQNHNKILVKSMIDSQLAKKTRILKKNNVITSLENKKYVVVLVNKNNPSLVLSLT